MNAPSTITAAQQRRALREAFLDLNSSEVNVLAGMLVQHLLTTDADTFARMLDEARAIA